MSELDLKEKIAEFVDIEMGYKSDCGHKDGKKKGF